MKLRVVCRSTRVVRPKRDQRSMRISRGHCRQCSRTWHEIVRQAAKQLLNRLIFGLKPGSLSRCMLPLSAPLRDLPVCRKANPSPSLTHVSPSRDLRRICAHVDSPGYPNHGMMQKLANGKSARIRNDNPGSTATLSTQECCS